jgi:hypothetical protein
MADVNVNLMDLEFRSFISINRRDPTPEEQRAIRKMRHKNYILREKRNKIAHKYEMELQRASILIFYNEFKLDLLTGLR